MAREALREAVRQAREDLRRAAQRLADAYPAGDGSSVAEQVYLMSKRLAELADGDDGTRMTLALIEQEISSGGGS